MPSWLNAVSASVLTMRMRIESCGRPLVCVVNAREAQRVERQPRSWPNHRLLSRLQQTAAAPGGPPSALSRRRSGTRAAPTAVTLGRSAVQHRRGGARPRVNEKQHAAAGIQIHVARVSAAVNRTKFITGRAAPKYLPFPDGVPRPRRI
jgi:hypothetical protein